jgi:hypothetical protein
MLYLQERTLIPIEQEARYAPEPVWMNWRREKPLAPAVIQTLDYPAHSLVNIPITLYRS